LERESKIKLLNYVSSYVQCDNRLARDRYNLTLRVSKTTAQQFFELCGKLDLRRGTSRANLAVEALMRYFIAAYGDQPKIVQTTLSKAIVKHEAKRCYVAGCNLKPAYEVFLRRDTGETVVLHACVMHKSVKSAGETVVGIRELEQCFC